MSHLHNRINKYYLSETEEPMVHQNDWDSDEHERPREWYDDEDEGYDSKEHFNEKDVYGYSNNLDEEYPESNLAFSDTDMRNTYHDGYDYGFSRGMQHALKQRHLDALVIAATLSGILGFVLGTVTRITFG